MEYLAHFNKYSNEKQLLKVHLNETAQMNANAIPYEILGFKNVSWPDIKRIAFFSGLFHDVGKYTKFFQDYLRNEEHSKYSQHSQVSACILYNWLNEEYPIKKYDKNDPTNSSHIAQNILSYMVVKYHHGNLFQIPTESDYLSEDETLSTIYKNLSYKETLIKEDLKIRKRKNLLLTDNEILKDNFYFKIAPHLLQSRIITEEWFFYLQLLFSILVDNDKLNSAGIKPTKITINNPEKVLAYIQKKSKNTHNNINKKREAFRKSVLQKINSLSDDDIKSNGIYTITAPTGIGKTLTSIQAALLLSNRLHKIHGYKPRIITAIPFINIIEQTKIDYLEIFGNDKVLVHHRFAITENQKEEEKDINKDYLNLESWNAEIILTTFVQLFHSVLTGKNRLLKKLNKFVGSIVILDEIQSIPEKYYPLIGWLLNKMTEFYRTKFILMTATKPKIIEFANKLQGDTEEIQTIELFEENKKYFESQDRTQLVPYLENKMTTEGLADFIEEKYPGKGSMLIVVNTIRRSLEVFEELRTRYEKQGVEILYLSTNIIPLSRKQVIGEAQILLSQERKVMLVSTQTIEAGVDLDFDQGIRDSAPLSSIIQTAGRVNREGRKKSHRPLYIVNLEDDSEKVYRMHNTYNTRAMLTHAVMEENYFETIENYYNKQLLSSASDESVCIIEKGIKELNYDEIEKFELIKNLPGIVDVFVEYDEEATSLADEYEMTRELLKSSTKNQKYMYKDKLKNILKQMGNYIISIRTNRMKEGNKPPEFEKRNGVDANFLWIPPDEADGMYYHTITGFKDESFSAFIF